jgi:hypothetical protein
MMTRIYSISGERGGVGKSTCAKACIQWHLDRALPLVVFDADRTSPNVFGSYKREIKCKLAIFSESSRLEDGANEIYNTASTGQGAVLVNMPAQVFIAFRNWIEQNSLLSLAVEDQVQFVVMFVSDGSHESIKLFKQSVGHFGAIMPHYLVQNHGRCEEWGHLDEDTELQGLMETHNVGIIPFPRYIGIADLNIIEGENLSFGMARGYKRFSSLSRQRVKTFLDKAYQGFEVAGVFADAP